MLLIASFWVALVNLVLLVCALALNHEALSNPAWFMELPWPWFGTELAGALEMQPVEAGALWALWLAVSVLLCLGSGLNYAFAAQAARAAKRPRAPTPQVAAMFDQLSSGMEGLGGFGEHDLRNLQPASAPPARAAEPVLDAAPLSKQAGAHAAASIAVSLQHIDPQLRSSYEALVQELGPDKPLH